MTCRQLLPWQAVHLSDHASAMHAYLCFPSRRDLCELNASQHTSKIRLGTLGPAPWRAVVHPTLLTQCSSASATDTSQVDRQASGHRHNRFCPPGPRLFLLVRHLDRPQGIWCCPIAGAMAKQDRCLLIFQLPRHQRDAGFHSCHHLMWLTSSTWSGTSKSSMEVSGAKPWLATWSAPLAGALPFWWIVAVPLAADPAQALKQLVLSAACCLLQTSDMHHSEQTANCNSPGYSNLKLYGMGTEHEHQGYASSTHLHLPGWQSGRKPPPDIASQHAAAAAAPAQCAAPT